MNPALKDGDCRFGPSFELGPNIGFELPGPKGPGFWSLVKRYEKKMKRYEKIEL